MFINVRAYLAALDSEVVELDPAAPQEPRVLLRVRLRAQVPEASKQAARGVENREVKSGVHGGQISAW